MLDFKVKNCSSKAVFLANILVITALLTPGAAISQPSRSNDNKFLSDGWHPYIGAAYVNNQVDMKNSTTYATDLFGDADSGKAITRNNGSLNSASIILGIGHMASNNIYFGVETEIYINNKLNLNTNLIDPYNGVPSNINGQFSLRPMFDIGLRVGYAINQYIMPYIKGGLAIYDGVSSPLQSFMGTHYGLQFGNVAVVPYLVDPIARTQRTDGSMPGYFIGVGADVKITKHIFLRGEYNFSQVALNSTKFYSNDLGLMYGVNGRTYFEVHKFKVGLVLTL